MKAIEPAYIFTVRAGFPTEALCISAVFNRKLLFIQNDVTVDIGYRNFSRRNQIEIVYFAMVHLSFFIRKLSGSIAGSSVYNCWRHDFGISGFTCFIQEKVNQCALQLSSFAFVNRKTCTGYFYTQIKVNQVVFLSQFPMGECICGKLSFHTSHFLNYIVLGTNTFGHTVVGNIGNGIQQIQHVVGSLVHVGLQCFIALLYLGYTGFCNFSFFLFAFFHQLTDRFRK